MARIARVVATCIPHHVTQRGNRRQVTFFEEADYRAYLALLAEWCASCRVDVWAYCLMSNHVHLLVVPHEDNGLHKAIAETHRRYTRMINFRMGWRGCLWQGRFASFPTDEQYLLAVARYIELNPVRAKLCIAPGGDYPWSSAGAHLAGTSDSVVKVAPLLERVPDWHAFLMGGIEDSVVETLRRHERTGRPFGSTAFIADLEKRLDRHLAPRKRGPKTNPPSPICGE
ncbi:MAG: transposase [Magnetococcales bacterium]|nr:transposase [Magnetococcales bacterium]